jgi:hypothetical protein
VKSSGSAGGRYLWQPGRSSNFSSTVRASDTVAVFNDGDTGKTSQDRVSSLIGQGGALELEIESLETRNDLSYDVIRSTIREELDEASDADSG